jgi:hypothetical protein
LGFRATQEHGELLDREATALVWLEREYRPVIAMLHEADLTSEGTDTEAYLRVAAERYRLLRTHVWSDQVLRRLPRRSRKRRVR